MRTEIGDRDDLPGVGIDERLEPRASRIVADLHNVRQGDVAVILDEVLEGRRVLATRTHTELAWRSDSCDSTKANLKAREPQRDFPAVADKGCAKHLQR